MGIEQSLNLPSNWHAESAGRRLDCSKGFAELILRLVAKGDARVARGLCNRRSGAGPFLGDLVEDRTAFPA
ncbi:hypothetical protein STA1M1_37480 [Sinisalibacter aestuarii]|uniref:Uncharacterized protein n=1 Tax=Sinisalibacter aestuarii TaxID=2949426 RepID=A0ABQ5LY31_9RHOB|nr:hypothetical protein [Sinisalibacter aestuarii]GKY89879.1 hypothetical protein STA1M1_37480 [Sinisalibacter aestuarii]